MDIDLQRFARRSQAAFDRYCLILFDSSAVGQRQKSCVGVCLTRVHEPRERPGVPVSLPDTHWCQTPL